MMFETLYHYLIRYKQISLPEIGLIMVQTRSAKTKFIDRSVLPPEYYFTVKTTNQPPANRLFTWLAAALGISETEAIARFNEFAYEIKKQLQEGKEVVWKGVGKFRKGLMNEIEFNSEYPELAFHQPVHAEKVIREHARHLVVVGEREKIASDISEIMAKPEEAARPGGAWWTWPVVLVVLSLFFIGWYFSENGVNVSSSSNTETFTPKEAPSGFYFSK